MPANAVRDEFPPDVLADRQEGFGQTGCIVGFPTYGDSGQWPATVSHNRTFIYEHSEIDDRDWWRIADQGDAEVNNYQGEPYSI